MFVSHPLAYIPSQLRRSVAQPLIEQVPETQAIIASGAVGHTLLHRPQFITVVMLVSQPVAAFVSQSSKPVSQVNPQVPAVQVGLALGGSTHRIPQPLQLATSVVMSTQLMPQVVSPAPHPPVHVNAPTVPLHKGVGSSQTTPQLLQLPGLPRNASQPFPGFMSQLPYPGSH